MPNFIFDMSTAAPAVIAALGVLLGALVTLRSTSLQATKAKLREERAGIYAAYLHALSGLRVGHPQYQARVDHITAARYLIVLHAPQAVIRAIGRYEAEAPTADDPGKAAMIKDMIVAMRVDLDVRGAFETMDAGRALFGINAGAFLGTR